MQKPRHVLHLILTIIFPPWALGWIVLTVRARRAGPDIGGGPKAARKRSPFGAYVLAALIAFGVGYVVMQNHTQGGDQSTLSRLLGD